MSETRASIVDRARILCDLEEIGLRRGDLVLITADLGAVGFAERNRSQTGRTWMEILRSAVGPDGTVIVVGYSASFFRLKKAPTVVFDRNAIPTSGALSKAFLHDPAVIRSAHPTCSYFGFGPEAAGILAGHDASSLCYAVIGKVIARGGKNLMLGTVDHKNAPMAFHYAQEELGHTKQHPFCGWFQSYYRTAAGDVRLFTQWDCGGCSRGAYHLYGALTVEGAVTFGRVGNARSALMDGPTSFRIIKAAIDRNRRLTLCDNPNCLSCYGQWRNTGLGAGALFARKLGIRLWRVMRRRQEQTISI